MFSKRKETYKRYPPSNPVDADKLCDAGFLYEGIGDKVKCFWCDGALEMWSKGDDPWVEHAKLVNVSGDNIFAKDKTILRAKFV